MKYSNKIGYLKYALLLGIVYLLGGVLQQDSSLAYGLVLVLGVLTYYSAKERKLRTAERLVLLKV
jgi:hypothetical protein